jgi:hypothetical protein
MNATRRAGFLLSMMGLLGTAAGCGGASGPMTVPLAGGSAPQEAPAQAAPAASASPIMPSDEPRVAKKGEHADKDAKNDAPREQPGLGTEWGETRRSEISMVSFERADPRSPFATASLFYNDAEGARAMNGGASWSSSSSHEMVDVARGLVKIGLRDETGRLYPGFVSSSRDVVVGEAGHRYTILVHNNTDRRLEVVLSVDGLDVLDGKTASFEKRGYLVDGHGDLEVDGFRRSVDAVAAFRFGSVRGSYAAQKGGDTRNIGVIGVALFHEKGSLPFPWTPEEVRRRKEANPFPGEFATAPGI